MRTNTLAREATCRQRHARLRANLRSVLVALRWTSLLYSAPGMLLVGLLVIGWILPAFLIIAALLAVQLLVYRILVLAAGPTRLRKATCTNNPSNSRSEDALARRQRMLT